MKFIYLIKRLIYNKYILFSLFILLAACASPKAYIDQTATKKIIWPGYPEKPRIQYLWSISLLADTADGRKRGLVDFVMGDVSEDVTDPRTSNVLMRPYGIFVDANQKMYIADPGAYRLTVIDMKTKDVMNIFGPEKEEFLFPIGVVADLSGRIYVSDSTLRKVFVFDDKARYLFHLDGKFVRPTCMAIDTKNSRIYVTDTLVHRVYVFSPDGKLIDSIGSPGSLPGEFNFPTHLFVDKDGLLYVTDAMNFRVQIFDKNGQFLETFGKLGDAYGNLDKPKGVAVDTQGNIYVVDSIKDTVKIFDHKGNLLLFFGKKGQKYGDFYMPAGIFIDTKNNIYVADTYNMRVQAFQFIGGE